MSRDVLHERATTIKAGRGGRGGRRRGRTPAKSTPRTTPVRLFTPVSDPRLMGLPTCSYGTPGSKKLIKGAWASRRRRGPRRLHGAAGTKNKLQAD